MMLAEFEKSLVAEGLSEGTVAQYVKSVRLMLRECAARSGKTELSAEVLAAYRSAIVRRCRPATVNLRIHAINRYLDFIGKGGLKLATVRCEPPSFTDNVVAEEDYQTLKARLRTDGYMRDYFAVWTMAATGVRVGELLTLTRDDVKTGYADVRGKGSKMRRVWFPDSLRRATLDWAEAEGIRDKLFLNYRGDPITARGLSQQIKGHARSYGLDVRKVHPHAFRHYFAKRCLASRMVDLSTLADMLGHSSIETTRIYLRRSSSEQLALIDEMVTW